MFLRERANSLARRDSDGAAGGEDVAVVREGSVGAGRRGARPLCGAVEDDSPLAVYPLEAGLRS